jgi:hypothetical protein
VKIVAAALTILLLTGCASVKRGIVGNVSADIAPFSAETVNTLSSDTLEFNRSRLVRLREYYSEDTPEVIAIREQTDRIELFRQGVAVYSLELLHIAGLNVEETEKSRRVADFLASNTEYNFVNVVGMPEAEFREAVANIGAQEKFLDAIKAVQPLIRAAATYHESVLRDIESRKLPAMIDFFDRAIEDDYSVILAQNESLERRRDDLLKALQLTGNALSGDSDAPALLIDMPAFRMGSPAVSADASAEDLLKIESYLITELEKNANLRGLIANGLTAHADARAELELLQDSLFSRARVVRFQLAAWRKAHRDLGNGVRNPGSWLSAASGVANTII